MSWPSLEKNTLNTLQKRNCVLVKLNLLHSQQLQNQMFPVQIQNVAPSAAMKKINCTPAKLAWK